MFLYGFVGNAPCGGLLLEKLQACTQPGLDGYGAALMQGGQLLCVKSKESVTALAQQLPESAAPCGLVHARFATCGGRTAENVHPFVTDDYCLAMNGTVENAVALRSALNLLPYPDSDGAVLAALLQAYADSGTVAALRLCCREARGNYALAVLHRGEECLFACAHGAPLYAAVGGGSACVSSDLAALEPDQMKIYALSAGECVQLRPGKLQFWNAKGKKIKKSPCAVTLRRPPAAGFADPGEALQALPGDLELLLHRFVRGDQPRLGKSRLRPRGISRVLLVGCGTSYQLAQAAACNFESVCDVPAFAYSAGEFCAGGVVCDRGALVVGISASGQTAEVAEALQKAAAFGARTASLTGDPDSPLARAGGTLLSLPCSLPGGLPPVTHFVLGYVLLALVAVADAFMLGGLDQNYMSAVSLATQIQFIQNMFLSAATAGLAILGAQYWGKQDIKALDDIFALAIRICGIVSVLFFVACAFFPRYLMLIFTNEPVLIDYGVSYLKIASFSYLLTGFSQCYIVMMKISEHAGTAAAVSSITVLINIMLNAIFIYGAFGIESMNVRGAALATLISRVVELMLSITFSYRPGYIRLKIRELFARNKELSADFMKCSGPILGASLVWGIGFTSYSTFMGHMGTDAAAANSVAAVVRDIICCLSAGISSAAGIMIGNELGAGNLKRGKAYGIRMAKLSFLCGAVMTVLMAVSAPVILHFVKLTPQAAEYLKQLFGVLAFYMIGRSVNEIIINGVFGSGGDTMFDMYSLAVTMWGIAIPLAVAGTYFLNWPVVVVYACTCVDEVGKIPWTLIHFKKYKWVKDLTR